MNQPPSNPTEPAGDHDKQQVPSAIKSVNAAPDTRSAQCKCHHKKKNWPQRIEAVCAILLVGITGFYTYYAREQKKAMLCSNKINRESLESVQRAFVSFSTIQSVRATDAWTIMPQFENSGVTPAVSVISYIDSGVLPNEPTDDIFFGKSKSYPATYIGPKSFQSARVMVHDESELFGIDLGDLRHDIVLNPKRPMFYCQRIGCHPHTPA